MSTYLDGTPQVKEALRGVDVIPVQCLKPLTTARELEFREIYYSNQQSQHNIEVNGLTHKLKDAQARINSLEEDKASAVESMKVHEEWRNESERLLKLRREELENSKMRCARLEKTQATCHCGELLLNHATDCCHGVEMKCECPNSERVRELEAELVIQRRALEGTTIWLLACVECQDWFWSEYQHEAAWDEVKAAQLLLGETPRGKPIRRKAEVEQENANLQQQIARKDEALRGVISAVDAMGLPLNIALAAAANNAAAALATGVNSEVQK